jgi:outer membrane protein TolC
MRIGSWVAESLAKAASRELGDEPVLEPRDDAVLQKLETVAETIKQELRVISEQNRELDQELAVIRRGLLPSINAIPEQQQRERR